MDQNEEKREMCYVCLFLSYYEALNILTDRQVGQLIRGLLYYAKTGKEPKLEKALLPIWALLKGQHDRDRVKYVERCETNRRNGKKGGRPRKDKGDEPLCAS